MGSMRLQVQLMQPLGKIPRAIIQRYELSFLFLFCPLRLWHVATAECVHVMTGHTAAVNAVVMTTDGTKTVSGSADGTIKVWSTDINSR